ncbi:MAG: HAMP domain-containing protein, partial [Spirochaetia bacterium]
MKNLKLAAKIGVGFGLIIVIAMALGAVAILNMIGVQGDAQRLDRETVPQVTVSNNLERHSLLTMYNMLGYALSKDQSYLEPAKKELEEVKKYLADAESLAAKYTRLIELRKNAADARARVEEYEKLADETVAVNNDILDLRMTEDVAVPAFMAAANEYLARNTADLQSAISRRASPVAQKALLAKIVAVNEIIDLGNNLRVANFKAQATGDYGVLKAGIETFGQLETKVGILKSFAPDAAELRAGEAILRAGADYRNACRALMADGDRITELNKSRGAAAQAVLDAAKATSEAGLKDADGITTLTVARLVSAVLTLALGLAVAALIGIAIAMAITRTITKPLSKGVAFAQLVASGDFTGQLDIRQKDEVGVLAEALNGMSVRLREMVANVQNSADLVASSSEEISASAQKLAEGSQSQASTLEQTSASVEELTASVDQVAEHAQSQASAVEQGSASMAQVQKAIADVSGNLSEISTLARASVDNAVEGAKAVQQVVAGITLIATSSEKIGGI